MPKICPIPFDTETGRFQCTEAECAWWHDATSSCAVQALFQQKSTAPVATQDDARENTQDHDSTEVQAMQAFDDAKFGGICFICKHKGNCALEARVMQDCSFERRRPRPLKEAPDA